MNEEAFERAENIIDFSDIISLREAIENITGSMLEDGFDVEDVKAFLEVEITNLLSDY